MDRLAANQNARFPGIPDRSKWIRILYFDSLEKGQEFLFVFLDFSSWTGDDQGHNFQRACHCQGSHIEVRSPEEHPRCRERIFAWMQRYVAALPSVACFDQIHRPDLSAPSSSRNVNMIIVSTIQGSQTIGASDCIRVGSKVWINTARAADNWRVYELKTVLKTQWNVIKTTDEVLIAESGTNKYTIHIKPNIPASPNVLRPGTPVIAKDGTKFYRGEIMGWAISRDIRSPLFLRADMQARWEIGYKNVTWTSLLRDIRVVEDPQHCEWV